jgi:transposase
MSQENITNKQPLIRYVNRQQMSWRAVDVKHLIGEEHPARAIWTLVGRLDLSPFYRAIESSEEEGGRPAIDPQLLISLWVYAYSQGIGSAREVARRCEYDPAFQWLTGLGEVNYHTLADFRVEKQKELDELFTQVLAALSKEGLITLEQVMQDGTKIKALASSRSYRQEETHSPWVSRQLTAMGHEVIVAHARNVRLITESSRKDDRLDARTLARLARIDPQLLARCAIAVPKRKFI